MKFTEVFLQGTARDYDLPISKVRDIAEMSINGEDFYIRLEQTVHED